MRHSAYIVVAATVLCVAGGLTADITDNAYTLRAGDMISVTVWDHPEYSMENVQIRPDGKFMHPFAKEVVAAGRTPQQLADTIRRALLIELKKPNVSVSIIRYKEDWLFVTGGVRSPGAFPVREPLTVQQAVASAGGPSPTADLLRALVITRDGKRVDIDLDGELSGDAQAGKLRLEAGDTLVVHERGPRNVGVLGAVRKPGIYEIPPEGLRVSEAVALAGGFTEDADLESARLTRSGAETVSVNLKDVVDDVNDPANAELSHGDAIVVPTLLAGSFSILGEVKLPGVRPLEKDKVTRVSDAIALVGGLTQSANAAATTLMRADGSIVTVNVLDILQGRQVPDDLALEARDTLFVPQLPEFVVLGAVKKPGRYALKPGSRVSDALAAGSGLAGDPARTVASIIHANGQSDAVDLAEVLDASRSEADLTLVEGDTIVVRALDTGQVAVLGAVLRPGRYPLSDVHRIVDLMAVSGLLQETGNTADLMRADGSILKLDLDEILVAQKPGSNIELRDGDTLVISSGALEVSVLGAVEKANRYPMRKGNRFADAIAAAGGLAEQADRRRAKMIRVDGETLTIDLAEALSGDSVDANPRLADGDIIVIDTAQIRVAVLGDVARPGHQLLGRDASFSDALAEAGGLLSRARARDASILRATGETLEVDLPSILDRSDPQANVKLEDGDTIFIDTAAIQVAVLGDVVRPGHQSLWPAARFSDAIAGASGLRPDTRAKTARLMRADGQTLTVDLAAVLTHSDRQANVVLEDGDAIFVRAAQMNVAVLGEVNKAGPQQLIEGAKLSDAIAAASGLRPNARAKTAKLMRADGTSIEVDLSLVLEVADPRADAALRDGDTIIIQADAVAEVAVLGNVNRPTRVILGRGDRIADAIAGAGGLAADADRRSATLIRADGTAVDVDLAAIFERKDGAANLALQDGDALLVASKVQGYAAVIGAVNGPGLFPIDKGERISDLLARGRGVMLDADFAKASLQRADGTQIAVDLNDILGDPKPGANLVVNSGDTLYVPSGTIGEVAIVGAVVRPGRYPLGRNERISSVIARGSGLSSQGVGKATMMHADGTSISVDVLAALAEPGTEADPVVMAGDTIVVNEAAPVTVVGAVNAPGVFSMPADSRVSAAIAQARGYRLTGDLARTTLIHNDGSRENVDLRAIIDKGDSEADVVLRPGDVLVVPESDHLVSVMGAVERPGRFPLRTGARLADGIALAEGIRVDARANTCTVLRGDRQITLELGDVLTDEHAETNILLEDGDTVIVGQLLAAKVSVLGAVTRQGHYAFSDGDHVTQAIALASGTTEKADPARVKLIRKGEQRIVDLSNLERGMDVPEDLPLQDGDVVIVPESLHIVTVMGVVRTPGNYTFKPGDRVMDAVAAAGGWIHAKSAANRTVLARRDGDAKVGWAQIDLLGAAKKGKIEGNPELEDGDVIYVPPVSNRTFQGILKTLFPVSSLYRTFFND